MRLWRRNNPKKARASSKRARQKVLAKDPEYWRNNGYKKRYGITLDQYNKMWQEQKGLCSICSKPDKERHLRVDHCHKSGKVRALLCVRCNLGIGYFDESPVLFRLAANYVTNHKE